MKKLFIPILILTMIFISCKPQEQKDEGGDMAAKTEKNIDKETMKIAVDSLLKKFGEGSKTRIEKGVEQAAALWNKKDGNKDDFVKFCSENFIADTAALDALFNRLSKNFEIMFGYYNLVTLGLKEPIDLDLEEPMAIDEIFAAYSPYAHVNDDFFDNKIAFMVLLNFPTYSLEEKEKLGPNWTRKDWAYARMGDMFTSRVPAAVNQEVNNAMTAADSYINSYNIYVGFLVDDAGKTYFDKEKKLISHWNLRDELKSQYASPDGLVKQKMIYEVMLKIINQEVPQPVVNSNEYTWNPFKNKIFKDGKETEFKTEPDTRYENLLSIFKALRKVDKYSPEYPTYISRKFDQEMEIPQAQVEKLFVELVSLPTAKKVGELIKKRLGRSLQPFDIWYDGFKSRSSINQEELDSKTKAKYPDRYAVEKDLPNILVKLGFAKEKAQFIASKIAVDPSRGPGHAWGSEMKSDKAHLRTRIGKDGMDYKGYNIAVHEFGHNVEQTISLQDVDYYMMKGVPNTAFTEAWAFLFQKRDLELLGMTETNPDKQYLGALDNFWSTYEIMGVSLVDMKVWKWLYENPNADKAQLKKAVIDIAKEVWNKYFAPVFGVKDQPILAIYSHMIDSPLYLSAYPIGHLIEFQMDEYMRGKNIGTEMQRIVSQGKLIPQLWMKGAVGAEISIKPTIDATEEALTKIK